MPKAAKPSAPRSAQNVLLTLGGLLLTVAAVAFTLVSWGSMGIGGRAAVLALVTVAALAAPRSCCAGSWRPRRRRWPRSPWC